MQSAPTTPPSPPPLFPRHALGALGSLFLLLGLLLIWRGWDLSAAANRPLHLEPAYPADLNNATLAELEILPGVGPTLIRSLDEYRRQNGGFRDVSELLDIKGIGPILFEQLKDRVTVGPSPNLSQSPLPVVFQRETTKLPEGATLDPNTASIEELTQLPGVGPTLAGRIAESRKGLRFESVEDLRRVRGIGAKTLENIRPYIQIAP